MLLRITVIPCLRLPRQLGFFDYTYDHGTTCPLSVGEFVDIPFRNKTVVGVVTHISSEGITEKLKPIARPRPELVSLPSEEIQYIIAIARWYCVSPATILRIAYPLTLTKQSKRKSIVATQPPRKARRQLPLNTTIHPTLFHYKSQNDCVSYYRSLTQASRKNSEQIIIVTPNDERTDYLASLLPKTKDLIISRSSDGVRITKATRERAQNSNFTVLIGTRQVLTMPYKNLNTIIVDQSDHRNHKLHEGSPLIDSNTTAYHKAYSYRARLIYASNAPRLEEYSYIACTHPQSPYSFSSTLVSLHDEFRGGNTTHISDRLREEITACLQRKKDVILSLNHTGMSKYILCKGCKTIFSCPTCAEPLRYTQKGQLLSCPTCTYTQLPPDQCPVCQDVNFVFPGLGIEKIAQQLAKEYSNFPIILVDAQSPTMPPPTESPAIIIGTSYLPNHYPNRVSNAGLIGLIAVDPIISMEQFRSLEHQWQDNAYLVSLASNTTTCIIQAFNTDHPFVQSLATFNYHRFADTECMLRARHSFPPARRHIVCIYRGQPGKERTEIDSLFKALKNTIDSPLDASTSTIDISQKLPIITVIKKSLVRPHSQILISIPEKYNPSQNMPEAIHEILMKLSVDWLIDPDPRIL